MYQVQVSRKFEKQLRKLDKPIREKVIEELEKLKNDLELGEELRQNLKGYRSIHVDDYRAVYQVNGDTAIVLVVGHRRAVYRDLDLYLKSI